MMPAAVLTISAGICETSPSPTVRIVYVLSGLRTRTCRVWTHADEDAADDVDER